MFPFTFASPSSSTKSLLTSSELRKREKVCTEKAGTGQRKESMKNSVIILSQSAK
jgi:hypothetical protein